MSPTTQPDSTEHGASKVALVTGAAHRIGRAIALGLAERGWDIAVHCHRSGEGAREVVEAIRALGRRAVLLEADLANEGEVARLVPDCVRALGTPACLVNNASLFEQDSAVDVGYASFERTMRVNLAAPLVLARDLYHAWGGGEIGQAPAGVPHGVVVNLLDQKLFNLNPDFLSYTLSKAALMTATHTLAQAFAPRLRVVGVAPGLTLRSGDQTDEGFERAHRQTPLGHSSYLHDVVEAVIYLAGAQSVTGTTLAVDGGQHLLPLPRDVMFLTRP